MYYIYRIINIINGHDYIGKRKYQKKDPSEDGYLGSGELIKKAVNKYGKSNFKKEILEDNIHGEYEASLEEIKWIKNFRSKGQAYYNISPGGENLSIHSEISKEELNNYYLHISEKIKENWIKTPEKKRSLRNKNMSRGWSERSEKDKEEYSKKRSEIQKRVYSEYSEAHKKEINEKRIKSLKEMHSLRSEEFKSEINKKISESLKKYNKNISEDKKREISEKISEAQKRYLEKETTEQRKKRSRNQSLGQGRYYKLQDPKGEEFIIKALALWCRDTFGEKGNSANTSLRKKGFYKGYKLIEKLPDYHE